MNKYINKTILVSILALGLNFTLTAQHHHDIEKKDQPPLSFQPVLSQHLYDPELVDYKVESTKLTVSPGGIDSVPHRHDCELFGYVIEGSILIGLEHKEPVSFTQGQMFYEPFNILHTLVKNESREHPATVLLFFIIKNGRMSYIPE